MSTRAPTTPLDQPNEYAIGKAKIKIMLCELERKTHRQVLEQCRALVRTRQLTVEQRTEVDLEMQKRLNLLRYLNYATNSAKTNLKRVSRIGVPA